MSNKRLKTITFPGLDDVYTIPDEAPEYSASATYKVGDFVVYGGALYKCNTAIESAEDWTAAHWTVTKMGNEVSGLQTALTVVSEYGAENICPTRTTSSTTQGITYTPNGDGSYKVNGTTPSGSNAHYSLFSSNSSFPNGIKAGDVLYVSVASTNPIIKFYINWFVGSTKYETPETYHVVTSGFKKIAIPSNATGLEIRLTTPKNNTVSNAVVYPFISAFKTKQGYDNEINSVDSSLSEALTKINVGRIPFNAVWEEGSIDASGSDEPKDYRIRTNGYIESSYDKVDVANSGHRYFTYLYYYDINHGYVKTVSHTSYAANRNYSINVDTSYPYYRIVVLDYIHSSYSEPISVGNVESAVVISKAVGTGAFPEYYLGQMTTVLGSIKTHSEAIGKSGISFSFITDLHWGNNCQNSPYLISEIIKRTDVNSLFLGGDYISQYTDSKQTAINVMRSCIDAFKDQSSYVYAIYGNHDRNTNGTASSVYMTKADTFAIINKWMNPVAQYGDEYFNFYVDDSKSKTRIICIDTGTQSVDGGVITAEAQEWVKSKINELEADWHVVVIAHWLFNPTTPSNPIPDGVLTGQYTASALTLFSNLDTINADTNKAHVEAIITGHIHCDANDTTNGGIPIVWTDTDSLGTCGAYTATAGTISEQCIDVYGIDYESKIIYCDRIGRGVSRTISYSA